jgi:hypothetical protein
VPRAIIGPTNLQAKLFAGIAQAPFILADRTLIDVEGKADEQPRPITSEAKAPG